MRDYSNFTKDLKSFYFYNNIIDDCFLSHYGMLGINFIIFEKSNKPTKRTFEMSTEVYYFLKQYNFLE